MERRRQWEDVTTGEFRDDLANIFSEGSRNSHLGEEFVPGTFKLTLKITPVPISCVQGQAEARWDGWDVGDTAMVPLQWLEEKLDLSFLSWFAFQQASTTALVLPDGPVWDWGQISAAVGLGMK